MENHNPQSPGAGGISSSNEVVNQAQNNLTTTTNGLEAGSAVQNGSLEKSNGHHSTSPSPIGPSHEPYPTLRRTSDGSIHIPVTHTSDWMSSNPDYAQYGSYSGSYSGSEYSSDDASPGPSDTASTSQYGAFPGSQISPPPPQASQASPPKASSYGVFPGSQSYGPFPGSTQSRPETQRNSSSNGSSHHVTDFSSFGGSGRSEPSHLAPRLPFTTEEQRLAHHLAMRYGDLGEGPIELPAQGRPRDRSQAEGGESMSHLAGQWDSAATEGGRAHAQRAWRAAITYGGMYEYDANVDETRDPELQALFEEADMPLFKKRGPAHRPGRGRGGWRRLLKGTSHEDVGKRIKEPSTRGRGGSRPRGARVKKWVDPGRQFKDWLSKANKAYVDNDYDTAADCARNAIKANPEVFQAYSLLSEILGKQGQGDAAVETMKMAAITAHTVDVWTLTADRILEHAGERRTTAVLKDALDCYSEALKIGSTLREKPELEFDLRAAKLEIYREMNDAKGCRFECKHILAKFPAKTEYCREYAALCAAWQDRNEIAKAKDAYDRAIEIYKDKDDFGDPHDPTDLFSHLNIYLELVEILGNYEEGLKTGKRLARWFLDRKEDVFWDEFNDDREFDSQNYRRVDAWQWRQGRCSHDMSLYGDGLPIEIKVRMGLLRLKMGVQHHQEAMRHLQPLLLQYAEDVEDYYDLFKLVAIALRERSFFADAASFFDPLRTMPNAADPDKIEMKVWLQFGVCYEVLERNKDAIACFEVVASQHRGDSYAKACAKLAKLYEDSGETDRARYLSNEVIKLNHRELLYDAKVRMVPVLDRPLTVKPGKLPFEVKYAVPRPKRSPSPVDNVQPKPLRELRPAGTQWPPLPTEVTFAASLAAKEQRARRNSDIFQPPRLHPGSLGPASPEAMESWANASASPEVFSPATSRPGTPSTQGPMNGAVQIPKQRKRKRGPKPKKTALERLCGDVEREDGESDEEAPAKPAKRRYTKKSDKMNKAVDELERRYQHISDENERAVANFETCRRLRPALMEEKDETAIAEWIAAAKSLLDTFTSMKLFFPGGVSFLEAKDPDELAALNGKRIRRNELTGPQEFLTVEFSEWQRVFVELTIYYANNGEQIRCYEMLQKVLFAATPFIKAEYEWINFATAIQCGLAFNDSQYIIEIARKIAADSDHRAPMTAQLFAALNRFPYGSNWFTAGPTQKWMLRLVKIFDFMAMTPQQRVEMDWSGQAASLWSRADKLDHDPNKPTEPNVQVLLTYGHMVAQANHCHSSLPYYYRALALQPDNIAVNLSIATMWIQNSMKRQTENRQLGITEGLAFLYRYHDLRIASGKACHIQEAEYNVARMWHYLGLTHLALPAYEKVLALSKQVQAERVEEDGPLNQDVEDFAQEAAFALQGIYSLAGNLEAAQAITEEWLVF